MNTTRKNILSVLALGVVGILLVAGAFFINSRINQKESVAPTAPESKPAAGSCTLEFTVSGPTPSPTPPGVCVDTYADVMIIIDRSDSMNKLESGKKKIEWVKESANNLIDAYGQASNGRIRFGVVVFGMKGVASSSSDIYAARTLSAPTNNYTQLKQIISGIAETDSGTCIECGLRLANTELEKSASGTARVAILLSDGDATYTWDKVQDRAKARTAAYAAADAGRAKAIRYITARFGTSTVGETVMKTIAGTTGFYAYRPTTQEWSSALVGVGEQICKPAPTPTPTPTPTASPSPTPTPTPVPACGTVCSSSTQCPTGMTCSSGVCRNPSCTSSTTCLCPTPTPTPTAKPTPSPTPLLSCGSTCVLDGDCPASMTCSSGVCRNPSCTSSTTCLCPTPTPTPTPSPTPVPYCGSSCSSDSQCPASMICSSGVCRNPSCTGESGCICPTPTPTPTPTPPPYVAYCSQTCSHNGDCTSPLVCSNGQCRNPSCTGESSCQCPTNPPVFIAQSTPQPTVEPLPTAGSTVPTMAIISVGVVMILISIFAFVTI